jgi:pimeloyl-ACP methyl ester carboxylesterase
MNKLVFVHGWVNKYIINKNENIIEFYKDLIYKLNNFFEVYFVTLPGFSNNPEPEKAYFLDDYVNYLKKYTEDKNLNKFYLMGHSFGGQISCKFSYLYPDKVEKLILYNAACIRRKSLKQKILDKFKNKPFTYIFKKFPFLRKLLYKIITGSTYYLELSEIMQKTFQNVIKEDLTEILSKINVETIIIWGKKDRLTPLWQGKLISNLIKNSKIFIDKNGGHNLHKYNVDFIINSLIKQN